MSFFDLSEQEEHSFLSLARHSVLEGPQTLVRFSDSNRMEQGPFGRYWMYGSEIAEALSAHSGHRLLREIRRRWAIASDWGNLEVAWVLQVPDGCTLNAYFGFAKFQPKISVRGQREQGKQTRKSYEGGSIQLIINIGVQERKWIKGPFLTVGLSARHLKP